MSALRDFRRPRLWLAGWVVLMAAVVIACLLPARDLPQPWFPHVDKFEHFFAYAMLSAYAVALFARRRAQSLAGVALIALGIALEIAQAQLTGERTASSADALANALGVLAGLLLAPTRWATILSRLDSRWLPPRA